jgi:hypothetical protein
VCGAIIARSASANADGEDQTMQTEIRHSGARIEPGQGGGRLMGLDGHQVPPPIPGRPISAKAPSRPRGGVFLLGARPEQKSPVQLSEFNSQEDKETALRFFDSVKAILRRRMLENGEQNKVRS